MPLSLPHLFVALYLLAPAAAPPDGGNDYLTANGQLRQRLEIVDMREREGITTGTLYRIAADGKWSTVTLSLRGSSWEGSLSARGRLTDSQLARLAGELARHRLAGLRDHGLPQVNARTVAFRYGPRVATLWPRMDERTAETDVVTRARFDGILGIVKALCKH
jgi:hypothetical protein